MVNKALSIVSIVVLASVCGTVRAQDTVLLWGDTHVHTSWSVDAFYMGNYLAGPDTAYRFAKGEPILHPRLQTRIQIDRPLDFLVVADHAENFRWQVNTLEGIELLRDVEGYEAALDLVRNEPGRTFFLRGNPLTPEYNAAIASPQVRRRSWGLQVDAASRHNEPGRFTALTGWEWSSNGGGSNLHRVVFSPSDAQTLKQFIPYSNAESVNPEDLWDWLDETAAATGAQFVAIPHNSNLSRGFMFADTYFDGRPVDAAWARQRARWEPVMEITQTKGTSETHPALSVNDEFARFELYEQLLDRSEFRPLRADYARTALLTGLVLEQAVGINPYRLGFIGSTDSHTGFSTVEENDFFGKAVSDALPQERLDRVRNVFRGWEMSASGLAAVWAEENSRSAIADAFRRREVYATSGPRILLRVFGGFDFDAADTATDIAAIGYARGVAMGGDLTRAPRNRAPSLLIQAVKDPLGANLDRVQVVKGWLDAQGETHERIYDVAWAGERRVGDNGRPGPVGDTVDRQRVRYANSIGAPQLTVAWVDPDFDREQRAFYYVRVLEIPTPRHSLYDAVALQVDPSETGMPQTIQERAWSSPIWYTPDR